MKFKLGMLIFCSFALQAADYYHDQLTQFKEQCAQLSQWSDAYDFGSIVTHDLLQHQVDLYENSKAAVGSWQQLQEQGRLLRLLQKATDTAKELNQDEKDRIVNSGLKDLLFKLVDKEEQSATDFTPFLEAAYGSWIAEIDPTQKATGLFFLRTALQ